MFCQSCGTQLPDGSAFCASCGAAQQPAPQAAPQAAPQQTYAAPQQPYAAPQAGGDFMNSLQFHNIMKQYGLFATAALFVLFAILVFTGCQYGGESFYGYSISYSSLLYAVSGFARFMDIFYGIVLLAAGLGQVFFWAQFNQNNFGFLPLFDTQKTLKFYGYANMGLAAYSAFYFLVQGIVVTSATAGGMSFFAPWMGLVMLLVSGAYFGFTFVYYKNNAAKLG